MSVSGQFFPPVPGGWAFRPPVTDYSPEERARFHAEFRRRVRRYRLGQAVACLCVLLSIVFMVKGVNDLSHGGKGSPCFAALVCFLVYGVLQNAFFPSCPACGTSLLRQTSGPFCPECGGKVQLDDGFFPVPECIACGKRLRWGSGGKQGGRRFRIRVCNRCGLLLDKKGF